MATCANQLIVFFMLGAVSFYLSIDGICLKNEEPKRGDIEPDLNVTVLPSTMGQVGEEINITCTAGKPRFPSIDDRGQPLVEPKGAKSILIFDGAVQIKQCPLKTSFKDVTECKFSLRLTNTTTTVSCLARNSDGACRVETVNITVISMPTVVTSTGTTTFPTPTPSSASRWTAKYLKTNVIIFVFFVLLLL